MIPGRCAGLRLDHDWDYFELDCGEDDERCPNPATCRYYNSREWIPLCAEHYDGWCRTETEKYNPALQMWEGYES